MTSLESVALLHDHTLDLTEAGVPDREEGVAELLGLAHRDRAALELVRRRFESNMRSATQRAQMQRACDLLNGALERAGAPDQSSAAKVLSLVP
ncbi:MAG: hypothetical protein M3345_02720 [Actinomycetota bacterium]|nr:hypothetical protein [Actinomycetota bacterium]